MILKIFSSSSSSFVFGEGGGNEFFFGPKTLVKNLARNLIENLAKNLVHNLTKNMVTTIKEYFGKVPKTSFEEVTDLVLVVLEKLVRAALSLSEEVIERLQK